MPTHHLVRLVSTRRDQQCERCSSTWFQRIDVDLVLGTVGISAVSCHDTACAVTSDCRESHHRRLCVSIFDEERSALRMLSYTGRFGANALGMGAGARCCGLVALGMRVVSRCRGFGTLGMRE